MSDKRKVLFLCTGNSCRSQMAEAILRKLGGDRLEAHSAGSWPAGYIHELAIEAMSRLNIPIVDQESKSWDELAGTPFDLVITLCDAAAKEPCPNWPGDPVRVHWSLPDPAFHPGPDEDRIEFALRVARRLHAKIEALANLDWSLDRAELTGQLTALGEI